MSHRFALIIGALIMALTVREATGQDLVMCQLPGGAVQVILEPVAPAEGVPAQPLLSPEPPLGWQFGGNLRVDVGFEYLRPHFRDRAVALTVPIAAGNTSLAGSTGNFSHDFAFVPQLGLEYQFPDLGFGVGASGKLISISGHLRRTINSTEGTALLSAESSVDLAVANFLEGTASLLLGSRPCFQGTCMEDWLVGGSLGARYSYVHQNYNAQLASGSSNLGTLSASQNFSGFGLTGSVGYLIPAGVGSRLAWYGLSRGSFLVGPNDRTTSISVVTPANPAASTASVVTESKTDFIGVGEFEIGFLWGGRNGFTAASAPQTGPLLWLKAGLVAQVWGDLGLLSATDNPQAFSASHLYLYGFSVLIGIDY